MCPICSARLKGSLQSLQLHCSRVHNVNSEGLYNILHPRPTPMCSDCGCESSFISCTVGYYTVCSRCRIKRGQLNAAHVRKLRGHPAWNKGLTRDTSESVARAGRMSAETRLREGTTTKGRTKETCASVVLEAQRASETKRRKYASGELTHWSTGLTKDTDERIAHRSHNISKSLLLHYENMSEEDKIKRRTSLIAACATRQRDVTTLTQDELAARMSVLKSRFHVVSPSTLVSMKDPCTIRCVKCNAQHVRSATILVAKSHGDWRWKCACEAERQPAWQREITQWITDEMHEVVHVNDRTVIKPQEIDIYVPRMNFGIECDGLYWHNETVLRSVLYHEEKSQRALQQGMSLLHIFDDEWCDPIKREVIKSMIRVKLGRAMRVPARKLAVTEITNRAARVFLSEHHLDGSATSLRSFALIDNNGSIKQVLTLRRPHMRKKWGSEVIEIARIATRRDHVIVGGVSRLMRAASFAAREMKFKKILTYRDTRLGGVNKTYEQVGFSISHVTSPRWWWTDMHERFNRFSIRATSGATQAENAQHTGVVRIFGCSNVAYTLDL